MLYANPDVADFLREHYVLHWWSVRDVPQMTIDFGGGRTLERTITGNSAHYVLDATGRPVDVLPGLYGPQEFLKQVGFGRGLVDMEEAELARWHPRRLRDAMTVLRPMLSASRDHEVSADEALALVTPGLGPTAPVAMLAQRLTVSKAAIEVPPLESLRAANPDRQGLSDEEWVLLSGYRYEGVDLNGQALMRRENPDLSEAEFGVLLRQFQAALVGDTVRNELGLHSVVHRWFAAAPPASLEALNDRVYTELFLTPFSDPWMGMLESGTYTGLERGGVVAP